MLKRKIGCLLVIILLCVSITPFMMAIKPPKDPVVSSDQSVLTGDFVSGPTPGAWGQTGWLVLYSYATNIQNSPGGTITIYDTPDSYRTGVEDGRNKIEWDTHGERVRSWNDRDRSVNLNKLKTGTYSAPSSSIPRLSIMIQLIDFPDGEILRLLTLYLDTDDLDSNEQISISVDKTTVTLSGTSIPFNYYDWSRSINIPASEDGGDLGITMDHDFEITIDK